AVLKVAIRQIREALHDDPKSPRYIDTAHRRGYRFIGPLEACAPLIRNQKPRNETDIPQGVVGRETALARMQSWLEKVRSGERQVAFVTGEAGIGKTALVDTFERSIAWDRNIRIGHGQCLEQYGTGEAYLPVLDAVGRLCREQSEIVDVLRTHAPM